MYVYLKLLDLSKELLKVASTTRILEPGETLEITKFNSLNLKMKKVEAGKVNGLAQTFKASQQETKDQSLAQLNPSPLFFPFSIPCYPPPFHMYLNAV